MEKSLTPKALAAKTNCSSLTCRIFPRMSRAGPIQLNTVIATITLSNPVPRMVVKTIAATKKGIAINISVILIRISSHSFPKYPATDPIRSPKAVEIKVTIIPTRKAVRVPHTTP